MATVNYSIFEHHRKQDGTTNVKIKITHNSITKYIASRFYVVDKQIKKTTELKNGKESIKLTIKDKKVLDEVNTDLKAYRNKIEDMGPAVQYMSLEELKDALVESDRPVVIDSVDFIAFCGEFLDNLTAQGKTGTRRSMSPPVNHLKDFSPTINANDVDSVFLKGFEAHLRKEKTIKRSNSDKQAHNITSSLDDAGVFKVMQGIRNLHNKCKEKYNNERVQIITSDPFKYYKMPKYKMTRKDMDKNLVDRIIEYRAMDLVGLKELSRDIFMLSLYLCGMNAKDMYDGNYKIVDGRIEYERAKTAGRRADSAFISVLIPEDAKVLLEKYNATYLRKRYSKHEGFTNALSSGHKGSGFTFYEARDSFASIAVNICGFSHDAVETALNHFDESRVINRYAARDWSVIDKVQAGVLKEINRER